MEALTVFKRVHGDYHPMVLRAMKGLIKIAEHMVSCVSELCMPDTILKA